MRELLREHLNSRTQEVPIFTGVARVNGTLRKDLRKTGTEVRARVSPPFGGDSHTRKRITHIFW